MIACPRCGAQDWKPVTESVVRKFNACGNCDYSPWLEKEAPVIDAKTWVLDVAKQHTDSQDEAHRLEQQLHDTEKPSNLLIGRLNKAKRLLVQADQKMLVAESLSQIVEATETGQITMIIPQLGMFQIEWGNFDLFKAIDNKEKLA